MSTARELERIRQEYARRSREVASDLYAPYRPEIILERSEEERVALKLLEAAGQFPLDTKRLLDVGCGNGSWIRRMVLWGARPENAAGVDLRPEAVETAAALSPNIRFTVGSADKMPFDDGAFDLVSQFVVFSSINDPDLRLASAADMWRVLAPGGAILSCDMRYNNPRNKHVTAIDKKEIRRLFPQGRMRTSTVILAPPVSRTLAPLSVSLCRVLACVPPLRSHRMAVITKDRE